MEFEFTGRHLQVTPAIERLAQKELEKLDRILDSAPTRAHVILTSEKHRKSAEIVVHWRDSVFTGFAENNDITQSIVGAAQKVEKQVLRLKGKFEARKRRRAPAGEEAPAPGATLESVPRVPRIISARRYRVKPMTPEEAATIVEDSPDQFIVFRDSETNKIGVLYKRKDGNFGLIEP
ncbi:MAG TPA: ribosome-associated translation inhibitor RaiA [Blastocatellia bacterium]|nr:ribosome-associated translation inhibitor RaiA [Blastocatellia bacterium]